MSKQEKVLIFSHENDIDGLGSIVLGKIAFGEIEYILASNVNVLEEKFRKCIEDGSLSKYDRIYVTDLALYDPSLKIISEDPELSKKVLVFDHHKSAINEGYNRCDFTTIMEVDEKGLKRCGTDLLYSYLCSIGLLTKNESLDEFVELTRLEDTWEWKKTGTKGLKAHDMAILFNAIGIDQYIESMFKKIVSRQIPLTFTEEEQKVVDQKKSEYLATLQRIWSKSEYFKDEFGNIYAGVFVDYEYRNELGEYVRGLNERELKYLVLVALEKGAFGQKSYRAIEEGFDVGKIAEAHGGNGHPAAASVNITEEQKERSLVLRKKSDRESLKYLIESSYTE